MSAHREQVEQMEAAVAAGLDPLLSEFELAYASADTVLRFLASESFELPRPYGVVRVALLSRLADDLRAIWLTAERGYVAQACTIGSSAYESACALAKVGRFDDAAITWLAWERSDRMPWSVAEASKALPANQYPLYQFLCSLKHANPRMQGTFEPELTLDQHYLNADPTLSPAIIRRVFLALYAPYMVAVLAVIAMEAGDIQFDEGPNEVFRTFFEEQTRLTRMFTRLKDGNHSA